MRAAVLLLFVGCAPIHVGPGRVLPVALQYDPASFASTPKDRKATPPHKLTLPNGLEIFWAEDHSSPLVDVSVLLGCGRGDEPVGVPEVTGSMLQCAFSGGAGARSGAAQRRAWAELGLVPDIRLDDGESWVSFTVRVEDLPRAVELLRDTLASPRFEADTVAEDRERWIARYDSPVVRHQRLARLTKARAIYGNTPTLSAVATAESVRRITGEMLATQAALCLQPANLVFSVSGDVTEASLSAAFAPLAGLSPGAAVKHLPAAPLPTEHRVWLVPSKLTNRVEVEFVGPGLTPGSRSRAAAAVMMASLLSHLQSELREEMGHVYSVSGEVEVGPGSGATWFHFSTRSEVALEAVRRTIEIVLSWWQSWPFDEPLTSRVVAALRKNEARAEANPVAFAAAKARLQDKGGTDERSVDEQFSQVRAEDVRAVFVRTLRLEQLQVIVSGNFDPTLDWGQFGPVTRVEPAR